MYAIEIEGLEKTYRGKKWARVEALRGLSLTIEPGEVFGFLGPNGAGKSTTIKALMGLIRPTGGTASISGIPIDSTYARRDVGYLPENPAFYDYLSAEEVLSFVGRVFGMESSLIRKQADHLLNRLDLHDSRKRIIRSYSKGMVQRLGIAQALFHDPDIYILDEPMSGLDPVGRALVKEIITELRGKGKTVFFSTHITSDVEDVCDRVGILVKGELKRIERVNTILSAGIEQYQVRFRIDDFADEKSELIASSQLAETLISLRDRGAVILLVEPCRKSLEDFFLAVVRGN